MISYSDKKFKPKSNYSSSNDRVTLTNKGQEQCTKLNNKKQSSQFSNL